MTSDAIDLARFNGATSQGRGRRRCVRLRSRSCRRASMGPRLKDVEDAFSYPRCTYYWSASMGPRLKDVEDRIDFHESTYRLIDASMGPRLKDVEDLVPPGSSATDHCASMGPRLKDVEDGHVGASPGRVALASMGPRLKDVEDTPV